MGSGGGTPASPAGGRGEGRGRRGEWGPGHLPELEWPTSVLSPGAWARLFLAAWRFAPGIFMPRTAAHMSNSARILFHATFHSGTCAQDNIAEQ